MEPAFPVSTIDGHTNEGMSLRDYFAAAALQGLLACRNDLMEPEWYATVAGKLADAMIAERSKRDA